MHPDVDKLMELQRLDLEAKRLREEIVALPATVAQLGTKAQAVAGQRALVLDLLAKEEVLRRRQELDVKEHQAKIAKLTKQLDGATSAAQVAAFQHEIAFAREAISKLEDAELESMERSEGLEAQKKVADEAVAAAERRFASERERAEQTVAQDRIALEELGGRRTAQRAEIAEEVLSLYDRIAKAKGTAVAEVKMQKCTACQMLQRTQRWNDLRDRDNTDLMTCESCGRLMWYDRATDAPQRKPVATESIAAQIVRSRI